MESNLNDETETKTVVKEFSLCGGIAGGEPAAIDVDHGKVLRIRPLHYDSKYSPDELKTWKIEARGKTFQPLMKSLPSYFAIAYKKRVYSPNRILYPLKRVDWDPNGERNPQNRGKSKYVRISWDEATDIIASEIKRIHQQYGPYSILCSIRGHAESKNIHTAHGNCKGLLQHLGGYTRQTSNPDSWEGWYWGAKHVWGDGNMGLAAPGDAPFGSCGNVLRDVSQNTEMIIFQGGDWETTPQGFSGQFLSRAAYWFTELGITQVYISPDLNYAGAIHADKWIPVLPNTDAALQLAIIYTWVKEGTYDKAYVETHTVGMDKVADYVLGKQDGIAKTPAWAAPLCGVPEWTIKALAREWASKRTSTGHYFGGPFIRGPYSHEPARLEALLLGMQGLGKPGINQISSALATPRQSVMVNVMPAHPPVDDGPIFPGPPKQMLTILFTAKAILNPPQSWYSLSYDGESTETQFKKYTCPLPKEEGAGGAPIHMYWTDAPCLTTCWNKEILDAYQSPKLEFIIAQHPWLENECVFSDIILPANTKIEEDDIMANTFPIFPVQLQSLMITRKAVEPIGESMSDYELVGEVAKKLGKYAEYTRGKNVEEWIKFGYQESGVADKVSWEELNDKGYYVPPVAPDWEKDFVQLQGFYEDPVKNPLTTPSGKLEFYSERLAKFFPDDKERPASPQWVVGGPGWSHDERLSSPKAQQYSLLLISNHPRWRHHAQGDDITWLREIPTCKVKGYDGYNYEPIWLNPRDAAKRGISNGDIVKIFNERSTVLGGALVTERLIPGAVYMDHGARADWIIPGELDRGGAINTTAPNNTISKHATGMVSSGYLIEVEKVTVAQMEAWKQKYPEAFKREYEPAAGLRFNSWVVGGMK